MLRVLLVSAALLLCPTVRAQSLSEVLHDVAKDVAERASRCVPRTLAMRFADLRLAVAGFNPREPVLEPSSARLVMDTLEAHLGRIAGIQLINVRTNAKLLDYDWDVSGTQRGTQLAKRLGDIRFDGLLFGEATAGLDEYSIVFTIVSANGECQQKTLPLRISLGQINPGGRSGAALVEAAARQFLGKAPAALRVVVLPTLRDGAVEMSPQAEQLEAVLLKALAAAGRSERVSMSGAPAGQATREVFSWRSGRYLPDHTRKGDWVAQISVSASESGAEMTVSFNETAGGASAPFKGGVAEPQGGRRAAEARAPVLITPDPGQIAIGQQQQRFGFTVQVRRASSLYCALQHLDGEAILLYPTPESLQARRNLFEPRPAAYQYPGAEMGAEPLRLRATRPARDLIVCIAAPRPLSARFMQRWRDATPKARVEARQTALLSGAEFKSLVEAAQAEGPVAISISQVQIVEK